MLLRPLFFKLAIENDAAGPGSTHSMKTDGLEGAVARLWLGGWDWPEFFFMYVFVP